MRSYKRAQFPALLDGVYGLISCEEARYLNEVADILGEGVYVELGTHLGLSAICTADGIRRNGLKNSKVITIDTFDGRGLKKSPVRVIQEVSDKLADVRRNIGERDLQQYIQIVQGLTSDVPDFIEEVQFLFIDADHSYEGCLADWLAWRDFVVGEVAFHDSHFPGVSKVLEEEMTGWKKIECVKAITVWHRDK